jgi:hypothetical protein
MPKFDVSLPVIGFVMIEDIEAESEEEAIEKAMNKGHLIDDIVEFEVLDKICEGNFWNSQYDSDASATLSDDQEPED